MDKKINKKNSNAIKRDENFSLSLFRSFALSLSLFRTFFDIDRLQEIWETITRNKVRSLLTGFGVFWGIFMLMIMLGSGSGFENGMMKWFDNVATNTTILWSDRTGEPYKGFQKDRSWNMRNRDIIAARKNIPEIEIIAPVIWGARGAGNVVRDERAGSYTIIGFYPDYEKVEKQPLKYGRFINELDIRNKRKVCVIGMDVYQNLFRSDENPLGNYIRINGIYYQVVGVTSTTGHSPFDGRPAEQIALPFTTLQQVGNIGDIVHNIRAVAKDGVDVAFVEERIKEILRTQNSISPTDTQAIGSFNMANWVNANRAIFLGIRALIWIVGIGTLLAGIVGISNIMMVTVKERTREIGVRRALGATPKVILIQILSESLLLTSIAGILGLCLGTGVMAVVNSTIENVPDIPLSNTVIPFSAAVVSLAVLLVSGLFAGVIPAWRALQIKAIDAIREE